MVILELYQGDYKKDLVAFDSLEEGRAFVAQIPGYTLEKEDGFDMESFNPANLPDYIENRLAIFTSEIASIHHIPFAF